VPHSFLAYIDEAGDDGIGNHKVPGAHGGQSHWLVVSACIFRYAHHDKTVSWRDDICAKIPEKKSRELHFRTLNHQQKIVATQTLSGKPIRAISVLSNKTTIPIGIYNQPNQLYFYLTRYLIERISWLCRDHVTGPGDSGTCKITFSRRGGMSYSDFRNYLNLLQGDPTVQIHWPCIDIDGIEAKDHSRVAGLQLADTIASAFACGVEPDRYGNSECRYAEELKRATYHRRKNYFSYGVKLVPALNAMPLTVDQLRFVNLFR